MVQELLTGKKALVTGGSRGLGKEICLELARQGAQVAFTYATSDEKARETQNEITSISKKETLIFKVLSYDWENGLKMSNHIKTTWGGVDILINNAGISNFLPIALMEEKDWDETLDINLKGTFISTKLMLPTMIRKKSGSILNIGSLAGVRILAAPIDYCASKAGMKGFTESLAKEIGRYNIRVNLLAPGILEGGVARGIPDNKLQEFMDQLSIKKECTFLEVAKCAAFLVSDKNSYMSGATIIMDGGL